MCELIFRAPYDHGTYKQDIMILVMDWILYNLELSSSTYHLAEFVQFVFYKLPSPTTPGIPVIHFSIYRFLYGCMFDHHLLNFWSNAPSFCNSHLKRHNHYMCVFARHILYLKSSHFSCESFGFQNQVSHIFHVLLITTLHFGADLPLFLFLFAEPLLGSRPDSLFLTLIQSVISINCFVYSSK